MPSRSAPSIQTLEKALDYSFQNPLLLRQALTHRSFSADHNERLEFIGDAALGLAVAQLLFRQSQPLSEGELSRMRANLVQQDSLALVAKQLQLGHLLRLGDGEERSGGRTRPSMLADCFEAVIGAVFLDGGFSGALATCEHVFAPLIASSVKEGAVKDAKSRLQEWLQARKQALPIYRLEKRTGLAHAQAFEVSCEVPGHEEKFLGEGHTRRAAEQAAAAKAAHCLLDSMA
jgi:ribonuclease III